MAKIIFLLLSVIYLHAEIININQLEEILPFLDDRTLILGLNVQQPPIAPDTLKQLAYIGIEYTFNAPFRPTAEIRAPESLEGGILLLSDFGGKAEVFRKWLEISLIKPSQVILIDDRRDNFFEIKTEMETIGIPSICFQLSH
jgi:hypothetical protein